MDEKEKVFFESVVFESVVVKLKEMGYDLENGPVLWPSEANQCFMQGPFAGHSIGGLVRYWSSKTGIAIKWQEEDHNF